MCFSASASFSASAVLLTIGAIAVAKSTTPQQKLFAAIPLVFGVQQFSEGLLWLGLSHPEFLFLKWPATYVFLFFAQVAWPVIVPMSTMMLEEIPERKKVLKMFFGAGLLISAYLFYCLLFYPVNANIACYHINYDLNFPVMPMRSAAILYFLATVFPPIISSIKRLRLLGVLILLSYLVTQEFYKDYLISVWCFFAAIISVVVLYIIVSMNRTIASNKLTLVDMHQ